MAGLSLGAAYHDKFELVWFGSLGWHKPAASPAASPLPVPNGATVLMLPTLSETIPVIKSDTWDEARVQELLKDGAVILPRGSSFGQPGNTVVTAHSSGFESFGPYRFAFAKLAELKVGDEFSIKTGKAAYTYRVYDEKIVWPNQVDQLPADGRSSVTLVTCWPIWTNYKRLLVNAELVKAEFK